MSLAAQKIALQDEMGHSTGKHELPDLPYAMDALEPAMSRETLEYHYGKHHAAYVKKLNALIGDSAFSDSCIEDIIKQAPEGPLFNNAAQVWNHTFFWNCMSPDGGGEPGGALASAIEKHFGSYTAFKQTFKEQTAAQFGSGWGWLVKSSDGGLRIVTTSNAGNPMRSNDTPLLTCDLWEHAFYIDYRNEKGEYVDNFWSLVDWEFVAKNLEAG